MCFFGVDEVILFEFSVGNFFGELVDMGESEIESGESDGIGEPDGGGEFVVIVGEDGIVIVFGGAGFVHESGAHGEGFGDDIPVASDGDAPYVFEVAFDDEVSDVDVIDEGV